jgi:peptidylprolyl isomerase
VLIVGVCIFGYFAVQANNDPCKKIKKPTLTAIDKNTIKTDCMNNVANITSGLIIEDLKEGTGAEIKVGDTIKMHYVGTLQDGTKFDSSYDRNEPFPTKIGVGQVIKGWDDGVPGMKIGGKRRLIIPSDLAYGSRGAGGVIPPNATLIFEVEAIDIIK